MTVDAILEATVHILEGSKSGELTTKQVAERAGVSIGSLYQYFPNKQALVTEIIRRKMMALVSVATVACRTAPEGITESLEFVLDAIIAEKGRTINLSLALHEIMKTLDTRPIVQTHTGEIHRLISDLIEARINRGMSGAEKSRLKIAIDGIEGAMSVLVKTTPLDLRDQNTVDALRRLFFATLDLKPETHGIQSV